MGAHKSKPTHKGSKSLDIQKQKLLQNVLAVEKENKERLHQKPSDCQSVSEETQTVPNTDRKDISDAKLIKVQEVSWPDPDPKPGDINIRVDDVTRMNEDSVQRIIFVRSIEDIRYALNLAKKCNAKVSIRGTKHSMGGHTIAKNGVFIYMANMNKIKYEPGKQ